MIIIVVGYHCFNCICIKTNFWVLLKTNSYLRAFFRLLDKCIKIIQCSWIIWLQRITSLFFIFSYIKVLKLFWRNIFVFFLAIYMVQIFWTSLLLIHLYWNSVLLFLLNHWFRCTLITFYYIFNGITCDLILYFQIFQNQLIVLRFFINFIHLR